jgi:hypothetical protein
VVRYFFNALFSGSSRSAGDLLIRLGRHYDQQMLHSLVVHPNEALKCGAGYGERFRIVGANIPVQFLGLLCNLKLCSLLFYITMMISFDLDGIKPAAPRADGSRRDGGRVTYLSR